MSVVAMPTIEERENLMKDNRVPLSGFSPRPIQRLANRKQPRSVLNIECNHFLRTETKDFTHGHAPMTYKLWMEAGKHDPPYPNTPDPNFNSNVWRNFRKQYGFNTTAEGRKISEVLATMYPLNIPAPSKVGDHTFEKYIRETKLFNDEKIAFLAMNRTKADVQEFKRLRCRSEARNPPIDESGNILPPENFKKYEHRFVPPPPLPPTPPPSNQKIDSLGQRYIPRSEPHLWKLSYKLSHPQYESVRKEIKKRQELMRNQPIGVSPKTFPSPLVP